MSEGLQIEATGETVSEAKWAALRELERRRPGLDKALVRFQVVSEGERGLLGVGFSPARVVASCEEAEEQPLAGEDGEDGTLAGEVRGLVELITRHLGQRVRVEVEENDDVLVASCRGDDLNTLIGKHGQTIDAIQYLVNAIVSRKHPDDRKDIVIDAEGYRARRQATLEMLAVRTAERAVEGGAPVELEPMTAVERKVVHVRLKEYPGVETTSEGTEPNRYVVVTPARA
ncbi:MAG: protein jag [Actinobacteria bacterium]|nr:protein jag [Actinomycetota bacterium]